MSFFDLRTPAKRFRFIAFFEALTWLGLLIGMAFKYLPAEGNDIGVKIFGPVPGRAFLGRAHGPYGRAFLAQDRGAAAPR